MILNRLIYAIGVMASAYILSRLAHSLAESLSESRRFPFIVKILTAIYYFSSLASLFFGLFMYYQQEHAENLQKRIDELTLLNQKLKDKYDALDETNRRLCSKLYPSHGSPVRTVAQDEPVYYMEAANGMTVRVPESKLEEWQAEQDRIRNSPQPITLTEKEEWVKEQIIRKIYGPKT